VIRRVRTRIDCDIESGSQTTVSQRQDRDGPHQGIHTSCRPAEPGFLPEISAPVLIHTHTPKDRSSRAVPGVREAESESGCWDKIGVVFVVAQGSYHWRRQSNELWTSRGSWCSVAPCSELLQRRESTGTGDCQQQSKKGTGMFLLLDLNARSRKFPVSLAEGQR
jgi:hypothetical protein